MIWTTGQCTLSMSADDTNLWSGGYFPGSCSDLEGPWQDEKNGLGGNSWRTTSRSAKPCTWRATSPDTNTCWGHPAGKELGRKALGILLDTASYVASYTSGPETASFFRHKGNQNLSLISKNHSLFWSALFFCQDFAPHLLKASYTAPSGSYIENLSAPTLYLNLMTGNKGDNPILTAWLKVPGHGRTRRPWKKDSNGWQNPLNQAPGAQQLTSWWSGWLRFVVVAPVSSLHEARRARGCCQQACSHFVERPGVLLAGKESRRGVSIIRTMIYRASQGVNHSVSSTTTPLCPQPKPQAGCMQPNKDWVHDWLMWRNRTGSAEQSSQHLNLASEEAFFL